MTQLQILSIQVGRPQQFDVEGAPAESWTSAIRKTAVSGAVHLGRTGLAGDEQADPVHHGGPDKAVLAYAAKHYETWNAEFPDLNFPAGGFGENLTVAGIDESGGCIGDTFRIGDCLLQISQPRQPCWKLSRRWNFPQLAVLVQQNGRTGWYHRVLQEGVIEAGMALELVDRPFPDFSVAWASSVMFARPKRSDDDLRLAACPALSDAWRTTLENRAGRKISASVELEEMS
ncbi:MAG: MOSC domain-containing protein [Fuerstia sp.]|nr:MOSC domain-containing protein [Fuerstiella sp.]